MKADDGQYLPIERLEKLRAERWRVAQGGFDAVLLEESGRHAARAREAFDSRVERLEWGATASAVLCAAAACECRVSEYLAHWEFASGDLPPELNAIRSDPSALSQWRTLVRYRSPHFNIGTSSEYQRLGCLLRTRDVVAHRNARLRLVGDVPEQIAECVRQRVIPIRKQLPGDWTAVVLVYEVAEWAHETARDWLVIADQLVPIVC